MLYILSDIFGSSEEDWMKVYRDRLSPFFELTHFDSRELAGVHTLPQSDIHGAFISGGIDTAVQELSEQHAKPQIILGFSVGGTIAWKYAQINSSLRLHLISATRIRNEVSKPSCTLNVYFGEDERHGPTREWFEQLSVVPTIITQGGHECYKRLSVIDQVCQNIIFELHSLS